MFPNFLSCILLVCHTVHIQDIVATLKPSVAFSSVLLLIWMRYVRQEDDPTVGKLYDSTEEGKKVTRNSGDKHCAVFRRIEDPLLTKHAPNDTT